MLDGAVFAIPLRIGTLRLKLVSPGPRTGEPAPRRTRAALELRFALETRHPPTVAAATSLHRALFGGTSFGPRSDSVRDAALARIARDLAQEIENGRLELEEEPIHAFTSPEPPPPPPPPPKARKRESAENLFPFELRLIDEIGEPVAGVDVRIEAGSAQLVAPTNSAGNLVLEEAPSSSGIALVTNLSALNEALEQRWAKTRSGRPPREGNMRVIAFDGADFGVLPLKPAVPNTVMFTPPLGKIFVELFDKAGRTRHAGREYRIEGPVGLSGKTDEFGRLLHESIPFGDYRLELKLEIEPGDGSKVVEAQKTSVLVLRSPDAAPQVRMLGSVPRVVLARLHGPFFDSNKAFLLPTSLESLTTARKIFVENAPSQLLIVGHTDTTADPSYNDPLSLDRAESVRAFLSDDVDAWLAFYGSGVPEKKRWGSIEDQLMFAAIGVSPASPGAIEAFQASRGLKVDGIVGPQTRSALIAEYMKLDGPALDLKALAVEITTHGCGENFPLNESADQLDAAPEDSREDVQDRRVELFFFDAEFGIQPKPPGKLSKKGSTEYLKWRARAESETNLSALGEPVSLELEWPEDWLDALGPEVFLVLSSGAAEARTIPLHDAERDSGVARLGFGSFERAQSLSLTAKQGSRELVLFRDQLAGDLAQAIAWEHDLIELAPEPEPLPDGEVVALGEPPEDALTSLAPNETAIA